MLQKSVLQLMGTGGRGGGSLKRRMGSLKTASSGVKKTMLVLTLSHSTRGGRKGLFLPFVIISRCLTGFHVPERSGASNTLSSVLSVHRVTWPCGRGFSSPHLSTRVRQQKSLEEKGISGQTSKGRERKAEVGPNPTSHPHPKQRRNPRLDIHRKSRRIHVFITACKVFPLAMPAHSGIINELFTICILLPATLSLASSFFFFCPVRVCVLLPIVESSAGKVHLNGKDICISEHGIAVIVVLGHRGDKTLELEHDVLHCSGDTLGINQANPPSQAEREGCDQASLASTSYSLLRINPFWPLRVDVSGTAPGGFFSKDF